MAIYFQDLVRSLDGWAAWAMKNLGYIAGLREELVRFWEGQTTSRTFLPQGFGCNHFWILIQIQIPCKERVLLGTLNSRVPAPIGPWHCKIINSNNLRKELNRISYSALDAPRTRPKAFWYLGELSRVKIKKLLLYLIASLWLFN